MTPAPTTLDALRDTSDAVKRAEARLAARRHDRDALVRQALAEGHAVALVARVCRITRSAVRKIAAGAALPEDADQ